MVDEHPPGAFGAAEPRQARGVGNGAAGVERGLGAIDTHRFDEPTPRTHAANRYVADAHGKGCRTWPVFHLSLVAAG
jgi:hypothetical protein